MTAVFIVHATVTLPTTSRQVSSDIILPLVGTVDWELFGLSIGTGIGIFPLRVGCLALRKETGSCADCWCY